MHPQAKKNDNIEEPINMEPEKNDVPNFRQVTLVSLIRDPRQRTTFSFKIFKSPM